jgi:glycosyltransferase involved in cell wall biosynthesis
MRIVYINTFDSKGGAAISLNRITIELKKKYDILIFFIVGSKRKFNKNVYSTKKNKIEKIIEYLINYFFNFFGFQYYFLPISSNYILKKIKDLKPDIIHLNNIHGGFFKFSLLKDIYKIAPIVWTLHDIWAITGHCTYSYDCNKWQSICNKCPNLGEYPSIGFDRTKMLWNKKKKVYNNIDFKIITPSKWLYEFVNKSQLTKNKEIFQIYNGINLEVFKPINNKKIKRELNIPFADQVLLFCSEKINNKRKGFDNIIKILNTLDQKLDTINKKIHLILIGENENNFSFSFNNIIMHNLGFINNEKKMVQIYNAADILLYTAKIDNLPNVLIESIACGTPCVTFDVGGCNEIIKNDISGYIIEPFIIEDFINKLFLLINDKNKINSLSISSREYAKKKFNIINMANNYYKIYKKILNKK